MGKAVKFVPIVLIVVIGILILAKVIQIKFFSKPLEPADAVPVNVAVADVKSQVFDEVLELPGRLMAEESVTLSCELSGQIEEWKVKEGGRVEKGQVLAVLNSDALNARLAELNAQEKRMQANKSVAETGVKMAEIRLESTKNDVSSARNRLETASADERLAKDELSRTQSLFDKNVASKTELDRRRTEYTRVRLGALSAKDALASAGNMEKIRLAELEQAKLGVTQADAGLKEIAAAIRSVNVGLEKSAIRAPFAGVFDEYLKKAGEIVQPGDPMGHVYDYSFIRIRVDVTDRYAPFLEPAAPLLQNYIKSNFPGAEQSLKGALLIPGLPTLNGGRSQGVEMLASIIHLGKAGDRTSNTFAVELRAANPGGIFKQGILAQARIRVLTYKEAILIPLTSIRVTENGPRCLVAVRDEKGFHAESRAVDPRSIRGSDVLVQGEIKAGDRLVLTGVQELLDGQRLAIINKKGTDKAESANK